MWAVLLWAWVVLLRGVGDAGGTDVTGAGTGGGVVSFVVWSVVWVMVDGEVSAVDGGPRVVGVPGPARHTPLVLPQQSLALSSHSNHPGEAAHLKTTRAAHLTRPPVPRPQQPPISPARPCHAHNSRPSCQPLPTSQGRLNKLHSCPELVSRKAFASTLKSS